MNAAAPTAVSAIASGENAMTIGEENRYKDFNLNHMPTTPPVSTTVSASNQSFRFVDKGPLVNAIGTTMSIPIKLTAVVAPHGPAPGLFWSSRETK